MRNLRCGLHQEAFPQQHYTEDTDNVCMLKSVQYQLCFLRMHFRRQLQQRLLRKKTIGMKPVEQVVVFRKFFVRQRFPARSGVNFSDHSAKITALYCFGCYSNCGGFGSIACAKGREPSLGHGICCFIVNRTVQPNTEAAAECIQPAVRTETAHGQRTQ